MTLRAYLLKGEKENELQKHPHVPVSEATPLTGLGRPQVLLFFLTLVLPARLGCIDPDPSVLLSVFFHPHLRI